MFGMPRINCHLHANLASSEKGASKMPMKRVFTSSDLLVDSLNGAKFPCYLTKLQSVKSLILRIPDGKPNGTTTTKTSITKMSELTRGHDQTIDKSTHG